METLPPEIVKYILVDSQAIVIDKHYLNYMLVCRLWYDILTEIKSYQYWRKYYSIWTDKRILSTSVKRTLENYNYKIDQIYIADKLGKYSLNYIELHIQSYLIVISNRNNYIFSYIRLINGIQIGNQCKNYIKRIENNRMIIAETPYSKSVHDNYDRIYLDNIIQILIKNELL